MGRRGGGRAAEQADEARARAALRRRRGTGDPSWAAWGEEVASSGLISPAQRRSRSAPKGGGDR